VSLWDEAAEWAEDQTGYELDEDAWYADPWPSVDPSDPGAEAELAAEEQRRLEEQWRLEEQRRLEESERQREAAERAEESGAARDWACLVAYQRDEPPAAGCPSENELSAWVDSLTDEELEDLNCEAFGGDECTDTDPAPPGVTPPEPSPGPPALPGPAPAPSPTAPPDRNLTPWLVGGGVVLVGLGVTAAVVMTRKPRKRAA